MNIAYVIQSKKFESNEEIVEHSLQTDLNHLISYVLVCYRLDIIVGHHRSTVQSIEIPGQG